MTVEWYSPLLIPEKLRQIPQKVVVAYRSEEGLDTGSGFYIGDTCWLIEGKLLPPSSIYGWTHFPDFPALSVCPETGDFLPIPLRGK
jgi:hypothetical protein